MPRGRRAKDTLAAVFALVACGTPKGHTGATSRCGVDVVEATIADLQREIRERRATCRQIVQAYLDRIAALDTSAGLHAITVVNPKALLAADEIDGRVARGASLGPLFCAPILVKDNYDTKGLPTTAGSAALLTNIPATDAYMVARLVEADAVVLAKTNMAEWAFFPWASHSGSYGTTANVYARDRSPAGSSGGTAVGVAASFGVGGLGSDTGNSIRGPSSHAALFGIRSTLGLASRSGVVPLFSDRDVTGPMTRTVEDGVRIFDVISTYDPTDPLAAIGRTRHELSYAKFLDANGLAGKRIGVLRDLVPAETHPEIKRLFERALADMAARGAVIVDPFAIDNFAEHAKADLMCPRFRYDVNQYLRAKGAAAPITDVRAVFTSGTYSPDVADALRELSDVPDAAPDCPMYPAHPGRKKFLDDAVASMDRARIDLVAYPTWTTLPTALDKAAEEYAGDNSQVLAPSTGMPAATVPMGFAEDRFPAGLQLAARPFAEGAIIAAAYAYEQATHHRRPPPLPKCP